MQNLGYAIGLTAFHMRMCAMQPDFPVEASVWMYAIGVMADYMRDALKLETTPTKPTWYEWVEKT